MFETPQIQSVHCVSFIRYRHNEYLLYNIKEKSIQDILLYCLKQIVEFDFIGKHNIIDTRLCLCGRYENIEFIFYNNFALMRAEQLLCSSKFLKLFMQKWEKKLPIEPSFKHCNEILEIQERAANAARDRDPYGAEILKRRHKRA